MRPPATSVRSVKLLVYEAVNRARTSRSRLARSMAILPTEISPSCNPTGIQTSTTSSETFKQAHLRLPKPPAVIPTGQSQNWSEKFGSPWYSRGGRPNSA
eukprot:32189_6